MTKRGRPAEKYCDPCQATISTPNWSKHCASKNHRLRLQQHCEAKQREAEKLAETSSDGEIHETNICEPLPTQPEQPREVRELSESWEVCL